MQFKMEVFDVTGGQVSRSGKLVTLGWDGDEGGELISYVGLPETAGDRRFDIRTKDELLPAVYLLAIGMPPQQVFELMASLTGSGSRQNTLGALVQAGRKKTLRCRITSPQWGYSATFDGKQRDAADPANWGLTQFAVDVARDALFQMAQPVEAQTDYRPNGVIPEDYYAL